MISPEQAEFIKLLGGIPVTLGTSEVAAGIDRGVIDGALTASSGYGYVWRDLLKYSYRLNVSFIDSLILVNKDAWEKLSPEIRTKVQALVDQHTKPISDAMAAEDAELTKKLAAGGMVVTEPSKADLAEAEKRITPYWKEWGEKRPAAKRSAAKGPRRRRTLICSMNIQQAINLEDLRVLARRKLPRIAFDFIEGGADDEACLRRNREAFARHRLVPRYLRDVSKRDQSVTLFGRAYASPFGISPTGLAGLWRPGADLMQAAAARDANVPFLLSSSSNDSLEEVMAVAPQHTWFQMYCTSDERINDDFVRRAAQARVQVLVVTVDIPVNSNRERNRRNGFSRPFRMTPGVVLEAMGHPAWVLRYLRTGGIPMMRNWRPYAREGATAGEVAEMFGRLTPAPMVNWDTIRRIRTAWPGPLLLKGILHPDDALQAKRLGVDGLVVSNHGGRQLDAAPSPLEMLPSIRSAVGSAMTLILDSGVRRGSDVVIARCLGADACVFGRPALYGVAAAGTAGAARALQIVRSEIDMVLAQIGCGSFAALDSSYFARIA